MTRRRFSVVGSPPGQCCILRTAEAVGQNPARTVLLNWDTKCDFASSAFCNDKRFGPGPSRSWNDLREHTVWYDESKVNSCQLRGHSHDWWKQSLYHLSAVLTTSALAADWTKRDILSNLTLPGRTIFNTSSLSIRFDLRLLRVYFCGGNFENGPCCRHVWVSRWQTNSCQILVVHNAAELWFYWHLLITIMFVTLFQWIY